MEQFSENVPISLVIPEPVGLEKLLKGNEVDYLKETFTSEFELQYFMVFMYVIKISNENNPIWIFCASFFKFKLILMYKIKFYTFMQ